VEQLALRLSARGHAVRVLGVKRPGRTAVRLREQGVDVVTLDMDDVVGLGSMASAAWKMRDLLRRERVDVVQSFLPRANVISRVANRLSGRPVPHLSSERSTDFKRSPRVARLNRYTAPWTDVVLAVSPMVRDVLVARDGIPAERIAVLENGIDLAAVDAVAPTDLRRAVPSLHPERLIVCSVGRFVPEKGFVHLVRAAGRMRQADRAQLLLVGEGPLDDAVRGEVRTLGLEERVHFAGFRSDVLGVLKGSDVYVLSSVEEGSPMVVLEAMACGLPIVATDVSGVASLVAHVGPDPVAIVVPPAEDWGAAALGKAWTHRPVSTGDPVAAMAQALDRIVADADLRRKLGAAARRRVEEHFTLDRIVERLEGHYARLVGRAAAT